MWELLRGGVCVGFLIALTSLYRQVGALNQIFPLHVFLACLRADFGHLGLSFFFFSFYENVGWRRCLCMFPTFAWIYYFFLPQSIKDGPRLPLSYAQRQPFLKQSSLLLRFLPCQFVDGFLGACFWWASQAVCSLWCIPRGLACCWAGLHSCPSPQCSLTSYAFPGIVCCSRWGR